MVQPFSAWASANFFQGGGEHTFCLITTKKPYYFWPGVWAPLAPLRTFMVVKLNRNNSLILELRQFKNATHFKSDQIIIMIISLLLQMLMYLTHTVSRYLYIIKNCVISSCLLFFCDKGGPRYLRFWLFTLKFIGT